VDDSFEINRANWDERAPAHAASPDYAVDRFLTEPDFISDVVRFDLPLLGDIAGLDGVHLQCHIGTDTVSLARLGAHMTGLDFSPASVAQARRLTAATGQEIEFVEAEVYDAPRVLGRERFDFVFTGIGALCWLPKIRRWAEVVAELLRPGGWLFIREGHPMLWALDESVGGSLVVEFPYFEREEPVVFDGGGTYVETDVVFEHTVSHSWNHGLAEIITALQEVGMRLTTLVEHDSVPWEALPGLMERTDADEWRLADRPWRLPHSYTLRAIKSGP
jgi:SAM-dependent methyltransferase